MTDEPEYEVGVKNGGSAQISGLTYGRASSSTEAIDNVDTIFLKIGRTPYSIASGGFFAPRPE